MGEVLSQSEIDSLLAALSTGELEVDETQQEKEKQVKRSEEHTSELQSPS